MGVVTEFESDQNDLEQVKKCMLQALNQPLNGIKKNPETLDRESSSDSESARKTQKQSRKKAQLKKRNKSKKKIKNKTEDKKEIKIEPEKVDTMYENIEIEYVTPNTLIPNEDLQLIDRQVDVEEFKEIFQRFNEKAEGGVSIVEPETKAVKEERDSKAQKASEVDLWQDSDDREDGGNGKENEDEELDELSRRKKKERLRMSIAALKTKCDRPDLVEPWDVTANDPLLLLGLKSTRNTVPVPVHWRQKRKYLQNKRGFVKPPFQLPAFIEETGIQKMREAYQEVEQQKTLKQKQRDKVRPKVGKVDIDYQVLHDAFFKFQTKPHLTPHGDLYYELRETEVNRSEFRPGVMSEELRRALGMNSAIDPPPWLINMQRYGPPPSYPNLKIPGLNAPIPPGASFGYQFGGWGKPPVDIHGRPLYGDVFGQGWENNQLDAQFSLSEEIKMRSWGESNEDPESESETEEEEDDSDTKGGDNPLPGDYKEKISEVTLFKDFVTAGISSTATVLPGVETPAKGIELRKGVAVENLEPKTLYKVLEEKKTISGNTLLPSSHVYDIGGKTKEKKIIGESFQVNISAEELEKRGFDEEMLRKKYELKVQENEQAKEVNDVRDIVAEGLQKKRKEIERSKEARASKKSK